MICQHAGAAGSLLDLPSERRIVRRGNDRSARKNCTAKRKGGASRTNNDG